MKNIKVGWGELGCEKCPNPSKRGLADSVGTEYDSKPSKLCPDLPPGVRNRSQCATIGANTIIPLWEPIQRRPGTRNHKGASRPFGVTPPTAGHRRSIRARGLVGSQLTRKGNRGPPNDRGCTRMHYSRGRRHSIRTHTRKFPRGLWGHTKRAHEIISWY